MSQAGNVSSQIREVQAPLDKQVRQAGLLILSSAINVQSQDGTFRFPYALLKAMNLTVDTLQADTAEIANSTLYDGNIGKYAVIFITSYWAVLDGDINSTELAILDAYELKFGVSEVLVGISQNTPKAWKSRYGITSSGMYASENITRVRWSANDLIETVDIKGTNFTLDGGTTAYARMGNESSQTMPYLWSYTDSVGRIRVTGIANAGGGAGILGEDEAYSMPTWLGLKLSPANKVMEYYWSLDIDDINLPPFLGNQHMNGDDLKYVYEQFTPIGLKPTLMIFIGSVEVLYDLRTRFPSFYNKLVALKDYFDIGIHPNLANPPSYAWALENIKAYHSNLSNWNIPANLLCLVTDGHLYSTTAAPAIQDSGYHFIAQCASQTNDVPPYCKYPKYDTSATNLFRIPRVSFIAYNSQNMSSVLSQSGFATWGEYYRYQIRGTYRNYGKELGYVAWFTHEVNFMQDYPAVQIINNLRGIGVAPLTYVPSLILANYLRFTQDYDFNVTYNIDAQTLTYDIAKQNGNAENEIMLILPVSSTSSATPLAVFAEKDYTAMLLPQTSQILITLGQTYPGPYVKHYTTRLISTTKTDDKFSFVLTANLSGFISVTKVFVGDRGEPTGVLIDNVAQSVNCNSSSRMLTITVKHYSNPTEIVVDWSRHTPSASFFYSPLNPYVKGAVAFNASDSRPYGGYIVSYQWDFGDGFLGQGMIASHIYDTLGTYKVTLNVTDSEGFWSSTTAEVTVTMPGAPSIWKVEHQPKIPDYRDNVTITANITSAESGIGVVILNHFDGSKWINLTMTIENELYTATIPALVYGTAVQYRIYASNDVGNWAETGIATYTVVDPLPPSLGQVQTSPQEPSAGEDVFIYAQVSEPAFASGIKSVTLIWVAFGGKSGSSPMMLEGDVFKTSIPGQDGDTLVLFVIESYDVAGNRALSESYSYKVRVAGTGGFLLLIAAITATLASFAGVAFFVIRKRKVKNKSARISEKPATHMHA